ncbi:hypothetical protein QBC35DRAFT_495551 [Podospora australis]|uniref:Phosphoglycerate mutase n=1 Tax=Podospora australis TaxID=1536484 RepID=A0AAN6WYD3_9PEZI|nr:hypothetical protein QBC35DRAFT_495551 [Podospora australis]
MGRPPAYLFVVRHGYRLDAADKQWHLSSPAPYDPPLTYSGWQQAKNAGARIASILRERVKEDALAESQDPTRKRKQYKVVVHTSPYLRCLQTSVAICAGLAQDSSPFGPVNWDPRPPTPPHTDSGKPRPPNIVTNVPESTISTLGPNNPLKIRKSVLRIDAFLGEWLSPTYFEFITPPPESFMMVSNAKNELIRNEDYTQYTGLSHHAHSNSQGQLWSPVGRPSTPSFPPTETASDGTSSLLRTPSVSSQSSQSSQSQRPSTPKPEVTGYVSPVPHYAISNHNTIPPGYVSHAKNFCVAFDYSWDSMRPPLNFGDGGSYPEEWTEMHKRLRAGLQRLIDWYTTAESPTEILPRAVNMQPKEDTTKSREDDMDVVETETVVILVSHGADCNALIGAITHQPALVDVAQTSITMAVRRPEPKVSSVARSNTGLPPVHELYDLVLNNSSDHLRSPPSTPASSRSPSVASVINSSRGRHLSFSGTTNNFSWNDNNSSRGSSANVALSGLRKVNSNNNAPATSSRLSFAINTGGITVGSGVTSFAQAKTTTFGHRPSIGLWSPTSEHPDEDDDDDNMLLNFGDEKPAPSSPTPKPIMSNSPSLLPPVEDMGTLSVSPGTLASSVTTPRDESDQLGDGPGGLWGGGPRPPEEADLLRDFSTTKRRWTVTERGA